MLFKIFPCLKIIIPAKNEIFQPLGIMVIENILHDFIVLQTTKKECNLLHSRIKC